MLEFNFTPFPTLTTDRLVLREITMNDIDGLYELRTNEPGLRYMDRPKETYEEVVEKLEKIIADTVKGDNILWTICTPENHELMGTTGFWNMDKKNHRVEIGYALLPKYWSQGIVSEANRRILEYAFQEMKVHSIRANINPENIASKKVLEKLGFRQEAHFTEDYYFDGRFTDSYIFSLLERWMKQ